MTAKIAPITAASFHPFGEVPGIKRLAFEVLFLFPWPLGVPPGINGTVDGVKVGVGVEVGGKFGVTVGVEVSV